MREDSPQCAERKLLSCLRKSFFGNDEKMNFSNGSFWKMFSTVTYPYQQKCERTQKHTLS